MRNDFDERVKLHIDCFGDDREWSERYLQRALEEGDSVTVYDNGKIASTLYLQPLILETANRGNGQSEIPFYFINCLGTSPDKRYRGFAAKLLRKTFQTHCDVPFFALVPFNAEFYEKQGFVPFVTGNSIPICGKSNFEIRDYAKSDYMFCQRTYRRFSENFAARVIRPPELLKWRFTEEPVVCGDLPKIISKDGKPVGYVFFAKDGIIGEYAVTAPYDIADVAALNGARRTVFEGGETLVMARLSNPVKLLNLIPYAKDFSGIVEFNLEDGILSNNNGGYTLVIEKGKLKAFRKCNQPFDGKTVLSAEQLTSLTLGNFDETLNLPAEITRAFENRKTLFFDIF